ncbi:MAG TPA: flagellar biosynthesis anti-sigma factor FlgM [Gammaproteobacteria bacterium]|nr:flagellar biosynthesis anti-sigma factor FlgM [Gammaproteobacteria bacterium]
MGKIDEDCSMAVDTSELNNSGATQDSDDEGNSAQTADEATPAGTSRESHTIRLTDIAARLKELEQSLANQPFIDRQRVEGVRRALFNGAYTIDAERVAGKIIAFEKALGDET